MRLAEFYREPPDPERKDLTVAMQFALLAVEHAGRSEWSYHLQSARKLANEIRKRLSPAEEAEAVEAASQFAVVPHEDCTAS